MGTVILKVIPMFFVFGALIFTVYSGLKLYRSRGYVSVLVLAGLFAGLAAGRLLDRVSWLPQFLDDWVNYRGGAAAQISTRAEPYLGVLSTDNAIQLTIASIVCFLSVMVVKRDAEGRTPAATPFARFSPVASFFLMGLVMAARSKIAVAVAYFLAKSDII